MSSEKPNGAMPSGIDTLPDSAASLIETIAKASKSGPPPVHLWNPKLSGIMDMRIARNGTWFHDGTPIHRMPLVRLFASILKREGDDYFLVTPVEKWQITVEDAPFLAIDFDIEDSADGPVLVFETNVGDTVRAGPENAIRVTTDLSTGEPSPYIHVRRDLHALIDRKSFYRLADLSEPGETNEGPRMVVRSGGEAFAIGPVA